VNDASVTGSVRSAVFAIGYPVDVAFVEVR
jgi:hypothetical protein